MNGKQTAVMVARSLSSLLRSLHVSVSHTGSCLKCPRLHCKRDITKMKKLSSSRGLNVCRFLSFCALVSFGALTIMAHMIWYRHFPSPLPAPAVRENSVLHTTTGLFVTEAKKMMTVSSVVHNSSAPLDEFQSILDETVHQLLLLKNSRDEARLPVVTAVKCSSLWEDNKEELERAIPLVNTTRSRAKSVRDYLYDTENCMRYLLHTGFKRALVSELEKSFPLAFGLMVYKDAAQVERLLRAVYRPHNVYCVHVDRKSDDAFHTSIRLMISCLPNVVLADKSFGVEWGTATVLLPELECMKRLWDHSTKWRYFINLTGQEFPLKTNRELVTILRAFDGANDIGLEQDPSFVYRWKKQAPAPHNLTVTKAPVHIVASRGYVDYVLHSRVARDFLQWILPSSIPDESFFGTLNSNPHLGVPGSYLGSVNASNKASFVRHKIWHFQNPSSCGGKWERQICHFGVGDLYRLTHSPQLFANKFSFDFMPLAYDCMEDWYFGKVDQENKGISSVLNVSMYEDADFVRKQYRGPVLLWKYRGCVQYHLSGVRTAVGLAVQSTQRTAQVNRRAMSRPAGGSRWFGAYVCLLVTSTVSMMVLFAIFRNPTRTKSFFPVVEELDQQSLSERRGLLNPRHWVDEEHSLQNISPRASWSQQTVFRSSPFEDWTKYLREFYGSLQDRANGLRALLASPGNFSPPTVSSVKCSLLWEGEPEELRRVQPLVNETRWRPKSERDYLEATVNCTRYVLEGGFRAAAVSEEELSFPLAFSLLVYRDVEQAERLLRAVYRPHNIYCVHVDRKSADDIHTCMRLVISCLPNVILVPRSINVTWGEFSVLEPEIECMKRVWAHPTRWRYFINLTGQEFPLKTNKELVQILKAFRGANDISGTNDPQFHFRWKELLPAPFNLTVIKGFVYIVASRGFVDYVIHSRVARDLLRWVQPSRNPDETFFSTLNHNPQLGVPGSFLGNIQETYKESFSRFTLWFFKDKELCTGKWVRTVCHFGVGDLYRLTHTPQLFANKFSYDFMPLAYDCLEEWYFEKVRAENQGVALPLNLSVYEHSLLVKRRYTGPVLMWD